MPLERMNSELEGKSYGNSTPVIDNDYELRRPGKSFQTVKGLWICSYFRMELFLLST